MRNNVDVVHKPANDSPVQWSQDIHLVLNVLAEFFITDTGRSCCDRDQTIDSLEFGVLQVLIELVKDETPCELGNRRTQGTSNDINLLWLDSFTGFVILDQWINDVFPDCRNGLREKRQRKQ